MKILIVDDEPLVRKSLGRACRSRGHEVAEAVDGQDGLVRWLEGAPELVFLDVLMPGLNGPQLLQEVQRRGLHHEPGGIAAIVILMSAYSAEHNMETALALGADVFIPKPFEDIFAIVTKAEELFDRRRSESKKG